MNNEDRKKAFAMRLNGATYEEIAEALHYDPGTVARDLKLVLERKARQPKIMYPAILDYVQRHCSGSIEVFARRMGVSPHRLRLVLVHGAMPSEHMLTKVSEQMGMKREEAFSHVDLP